MPTIRVELLKGRTPEQKKKIARELVDGFIRAAGGGRPEAFHVLFTEVDKDDWVVGYETLREKYPDK
ncbi:MAG: tautomerase family protein [Alphaproteobacteria bacterium]